MRHYQPIRNYETTVIFRPTLNETELQSQIEGIKNAIESSGSTIVKQDVWGRRRMAYAIGGHSEGIYVFFLFSGDPKMVAELNRRYQINENVLRSLTIKCDYSLDEMPPMSLDESEGGEGRGEEERKPKHFRRTRDDRREPDIPERDVADDDADENDDDDSLDDPEDE